MAARTQPLAASASPLPDGLPAQVAHIVHSETFSSSETLRHLLEYLVARALQSDSRPVKAKEVAASVFRRNGDFDAQNDSIVRVHAGRLRAKLVEYYRGEGSQDHVIVSLPKGSYDLCFTERPPAPLSEAVPAVAAAPRPVRREWLFAAVLVLAVAATWLVARAVYSKPALLRNSPALATFWSNFLSSAEPPLVVFSNMKVQGAGDRTMFLPSNGEVLGVYQITRLFASAQKPVRPKRGVAFAWDEGKDVDLIFIGSPLAETPLRALPTFRDFDFTRGARPENPGETAGFIRNLHPRQGEPAEFWGSPVPEQYDYALVALTTAFNPKRRVVTLAGISGVGTHGAADFVTHEERVQELLARLSVKDGAPMPSFEAVLRFKVQGLVAMKPEIVALHRWD